MYHFYVRDFIFLTIYVSVVSVNGVGNDAFILDSRNIIMEFDPYISILDRTNQSRYDMAHLVSLISHVATKFSRIYIELEHIGILDDEKSSLYISPLAIANYNCLPTTKQKIELMLGITEISCNCSDFQTIKHPIESFAERVNSICNNTVHTIVIETRKYDVCLNSYESCKLESTLEHNTSEVSIRNYTWGIYTMFDEYCNENLHFFTNFYPTIVVLTYCVFSTDCRSNEDMLLKYLSANLTQCKSHIRLNNQSLKIIKKFRFSDTDQDRTLNMSYAMRNWEKVVLYSGYTYIISQAFDTYGHFFRAPLWETSGWWFLENGQQYTNFRDYNFVEKHSVAEKIDQVENPRNFEWLRQLRKFDKISTGIIYTASVPITTIQKDFCRVLTLNINDAISILSDVNLKNSCESNLEVVSIIQDEKSLDILSGSKNKKVTIVVPLTVFGGFNINYVSTLKTLGIQYGYILGIEICLQHEELNDYSKAKIESPLRDKNGAIYIFHFEETEYLIQLGATRMFRQRLQLLEKCIQMVSTTRRSNVKIGFAMIRYQRVKNFYKSPWAMQNFVKYIHLLSDWAEKQNNTVFYICDDADGVKRFQDGSTYHVAGWYSFEQESGLYITKTAQALKLSLLTFPEMKETYGLSKSSVIVIVSMTIFVCASISVVTFILVKRHYKIKNTNRDELYAFFHGGQPDQYENKFDAYKTPYDKLKYEIPNDKFTIEAGTKLGSGEFGEVYRGTIINANGNVSVAIKTTNSQKSHKIKLTGFLSEIKVLSYLYKHPNIIELLGANTISLKDEKVYIFLELCHLGSLEKYLRDLRTMVMNPASNSQTNEDDNNVNTFSGSKEVLDSSLSNDLYRWCAEICNGMVYLAEKHVVHADLAARNVLLNLRKEAKICDFGLSRRMYNYTNYVKSKQEPLPWKWMAPEALRCMTFNEKTDVWAYGVTIWEIYSLGNTPFSGLSWDMNFYQCLEKGLKLSKPEYEENDIYSLMLDCWIIRPENRASFSQIQSRLTLDNAQYTKN